MPDPNAIPRTPDPDDEPSLRQRAKAKLGIDLPYRVVPYRSMGLPRLFHLIGRVLEDSAELGSLDEGSTLKNLVTTARRMMSDEVPGVTLRATYGGGEDEARTDSEGFFAFDLAPEQPVSGGWHRVEIRWVDGIGRPREEVVAGDVLVPSADASVAVVSDVDDTIIQTHSSDWVEQAALLLKHTGETRPAIAGMAALYRALAAGPDRMPTDADADGVGNPVFYVSRTGWNLYDLFVEFMDARGYPKGPMFLRDLRWLEKRSAVVGRTNHKFERIDTLIRAYPELPFVLVGDSGMHDPELYAEIVEKHPGRVRAVYLHHVADDARRDEVGGIERRLEAGGTKVVLAEEADAFAEHAARHGLVHADAVAYVREGIEHDRAG
jgi:phosphatidate phosphatase APP1